MSKESTNDAVTVGHSLDAEQIRAALVEAKETHRLVIESVRYLDLKIGPILTADSVLFAGSLAVLTQEPSLVLLASRPLAHLLLALTPVPLLQSLVMSVSAISPSLRLKPWQWGNFSEWWQPGHHPDTTHDAPTSIIFFGQIARFSSANAYAETATPKLADEAAFLEDVLHQTYYNAKIAVDKTRDIVLSTRGLFTAIFILFFAGVCFLLKK